MKRAEPAAWKTVVVLVTVAVLAIAAYGCGGKVSKKPPVETMDTPGKIMWAQSLFKAGRATEALEVVRDAIAADPENAGLHNYYGQLCFFMGRLEDAENALRDALRVDPYLTDAHNNLGAVYNDMGRKDDAETEFLLALDDRSYPTPEKVYLNLGLLYRSQGRIDQSISMFRKAVEIDPRFHQGHYELASTLENIGKLEEAAREYEVAAPSYQASGPFHYRLGFTYMRLGDRTRARQHLMRVLEVSPGSESAADAEELLKMLD